MAVVAYGNGPAAVTVHGAMGGCDQSLLLAEVALDTTRHHVLAISRPGYPGTPLRNVKLPEEQADRIAAPAR